MTSLIRKIQKQIKRQIFKPNVPLTKKVPLIKLGSEYGCWIFYDDPKLKNSNSTIISCGAGEDISFDIEILSKYQGRAVIVDPTPRAIQHVEQVRLNVGNERSQPYETGGCQPVSSYDLKHASDEQIKLQPFALWHEKTTLKFYLPRDKAHVSHSIVNYQNKYSDQTEHIEVSTVTLPDIIEEFGLDEIKLLKLDIEGAEVEVIQDMLNKSIFPSQLLVEFDEMNEPSSRAKKRVQETYALLIANGYHLVHFDGFANFCFIRNEYLERLEQDQRSNTLNGR